MSELDREVIKQAARDAAWEEGQECPTCHDGKVPGGRKLIHSVSPHGFGADWDLESVLEAVDATADLRWEKSAFGHDLRILVDGKVYGFHVPAPAVLDGAA